MGLSVLSALRWPCVQQFQQIVISSKPLSSVPSKFRNNIWCSSQEVNDSIIEEAENLLMEESEKQ